MQEAKAVSPANFLGRTFQQKKKKVFTFLFCLGTAGVLVCLAGQWQAGTGRKAMGPSVRRSRKAAATLEVEERCPLTGVLK